MRIAHVAPLYERVPPALYGGTERVVAYLVEEQARRGHDVTLFASGDSRTSGTLVAPIPRALRLDQGGGEPLAPHMVEMAQVFEHAEDFDLIHCHVDYLAFPFTRLVPTPTVHTLHGRLDLPHVRPLMSHFGEVPLVSISNAQRRPLEDLDLAWVATVHHGLPLETYRPGSGRGGYLAFLGRISPEKRPDLAIGAARRAGLPLKIAAKVDAVDRLYFEREIEPLLADPLIEYLGEIAEADKPALLGGAAALLFPIDWPEPFGLVMIEALACGTPVIARPYGSVPEIVTPGRTGFIADTVDELAEAVRHLDRIDRAACRREAEKRFSVERMVDGYEAVYAELDAGARLA
ncbi:MAG TPA: glycosyltransferase family 4 protein [Methylomirabilota bacterium]|nr:glycosyltransferase family 4 protein [Methylomirabilota bacterium]